MDAWRSRPVFISSTFKDMQAERDYLRSHAFPELEELLRARRYHLEPIDLRIGVAPGDASSEEARELTVLKVCLEEIRRSRPFLIVLLGDRYGWVPSAERMQAASREAGLTLDLRGQSVTALEIQFGILNPTDPGDDTSRRCFFYFRQPLNYGEMKEKAAEYSDAWATDPDAPARFASLQALKETICSDPELKHRVRWYPAEWDQARKRVGGLKKLSELVVEDLSNELDAETIEHAARSALSFNEHEREILAAFIEERSRGSYGREEILQRLVEFACPSQGDKLVDEAGEERGEFLVNWGLCITGESGVGKSVVFARLHERLATTTNVIVLAHAAGISARSGQVAAMLRRWVGELADLLEITTPLPENTSYADVERIFHEYLRRAAVQTRVVLLIDALDRFDPGEHARCRTWLPKPWPQDARLIVTAIAGAESEMLDERAGTILEALPPLMPAESQGIIDAICRRYHTGFPAQVMDIVLRKTLRDGVLAAGNPLWLTLAMDELHFCGQDDFELAEERYPELSSTERMRALLTDVADQLPPDIAGLYERLLLRAERAYGVHWANAFTSVTALGRFGWREADLHALVPKVAKLLYPALSCDDWTDLQFATLRRGFRAHIVERGPARQWGWSHLQMREAIKRHSLADTDRILHIHEVIADHLEALDRDDPIHQTELMVHLIRSDDRVRASRLYGADLNSGELAGATAALAEYILADLGTAARGGLEWSLSLLHQPGSTHLQSAHIARHLIDLLTSLEPQTDLDTRLDLARAAEQTFSNLAGLFPEDTDSQNYLAWSREQLGEVREAQGLPSQAVDHYQEALSIRRRLTLAEPADVELQYRMGALYSRLGHVFQQLGDSSRAAAAFREELALAQRSIAQEPHNILLTGNLHGAYMGLAAISEATGDHDEALDFYRAARLVDETAIAHYPTDIQIQRALAAAHNSIGRLLRLRGDFFGALDSFRAGLSIDQSLADANPNDLRSQRDLSVSDQGIADVLQDRGDAGGARVYYEASLAIMKRLAALDPGNADWLRELSVRHNRIGALLGSQGESHRALECHQNALAAILQVVRLDPRDHARQHDLFLTLERIGGTQRALGDADGALVTAKKALAVVEHLASSDPDNVTWQRHLAGTHIWLGDELQRLGSLSEGNASHRAALAAIDRLIVDDPNGSDWERGRLVVLLKVAGSELRQGNAIDALASCREALAIAQQRSTSNPDDGESLRDRTACGQRLGDACVALGDHSEALESYLAALPFAERLAQQERQGWDAVAVLNYAIAAAYARAGEASEASMYVDRCERALRQLREFGMKPPANLVDAFAGLRRALENTSQETTSRRETHSALPGQNRLYSSHPDADPNRAARLNSEYQRRLLEWRGLPFWKRRFVKKPEPPTGI